MSLLIHSMAEFANDIILPALAIAGARRIVEIGAEHGLMSDRIADQALADGGRLICIDPAPSTDFHQWLAGRAGVDHLAQPSLAAIATLADIDAWLIDGDHNYYTVYHELIAIDAAATRDRRPLLVIMHDVGWPCARRDSYYAPDRIPAEWRHDHDFDAGVRLDQAGLCPGGGFRGMGSFAWAGHEGGSRNGVLTALEDALAVLNRPDRPLALALIPAVFGLAVLFDQTAPWAPALAERLLPFHHSPLLAALERNRLANYLAVIDHQDRAAADEKMVNSR